MNKKIIFIIFVSLLVVILLPITIDWLIIGNNFPSNISNSDWVGFFGGYVGALLGAVVSLFGIIATIKYTNEQNKIDRELQVRPYCSIRYVHDDKIVGTNKVLAELPIGCEPEENDGPVCVNILYIKNIGLGPAIEFKFSLDDIDDGRKHYPILMQQNAEISNCYVNLLQVGEEAALPIYIYFNFDPIEEKDFIDLGEQEPFRFVIKPEIVGKYKNFEMVIHIKYSDMYQNQYSQKVTLYSNMHVSYDSDNKKGEHLCDINLKEITIPQKVKKNDNFFNKEVIQ